MLVNFDDLILGKKVAIAKPAGIHDRIWEKMLPILQKSFENPKKILRDLELFKKIYRIPDRTYTNQELIDMLAAEWIVSAFHYIYAGVILKAQFAEKLKNLPFLREQEYLLDLSDGFPSNLFEKEESLSDEKSDRPLNPKELKAFFMNLLKN